MTQKQVVAVLYGVSAVLGLVAVLLAGNSVLVRIVCLVAALGISITVWFYALRGNPKLHGEHHVSATENEQQ